MDAVKWFEVWSDEDAPPYLLVLMYVDDAREFHVYDVLEKKVVFDATTYETAALWLLEDEFTMVRGRTDVLTAY